MDEVTEADVYVRDHLLIQYMILYYLDSDIEVEELYDNWINWLKKQEEKNDERSAI